MSHQVKDVIVVGAGQSGLSASYFLKKHQLNHIVFERGQTGASWRSQRWQSLQLNTSNKLNVLPGATYNGNDPEGFCTAAAFADSLEAYKTTFQLPVIENAHVIAIEKVSYRGLFTVMVNESGHIKTYQCKQVIISSGEMSEMKMPALANQLASDIHQLHAGEYRSPEQLPPGALLVVGSAQSGVQIAEDLVDAGKKVFLSTSMVPRVPGTYRGKDIIDWLLMTKFLDVRKEEVTDPQLFQMKAPQLTGTGECRRTISLQSLARKGVTLLGTMKNAGGYTIELLPNAATHIQFADAFSQRVKGMIDEFIQGMNMNAPQPQPDEADAPDINAAPASAITTLNLQEQKITTIIWATGFHSNYDYLKIPVFDEAGNPVHQHGISNEAGLYFLGLHWLRFRKSGIILGIQDDAEFIVNKVWERHKGV
jgi:putative flavoprotein involved in K+ transport